MQNDSLSVKTRYRYIRTRFFKLSVSEIELFLKIIEEGRTSLNYCEFLILLLYQADVNFAERIHAVACTSCMAALDRVERE